MKTWGKHGATMRMSLLGFYLTTCRHNIFLLFMFENLKGEVSLAEYGKES